MTKGWKSGAKCVHEKKSCTIAAQIFLVISNSGPGWPFFKGQKIMRVDKVYNFWLFGGP